MYPSRIFISWLCWTHPLCGLNLNIDGSYNHECQAFGGIIKNYTSEFITSFTTGSVNSCLEAKIESGSKILLESLNGTTHRPLSLAICYGSFEGDWDCSCVFKVQMSVVVHLLVFVTPREGGVWILTINKLLIKSIYESSTVYTQSITIQVKRKTKNLNT